MKYFNCTSRKLAATLSLMACLGAALSTPLAYAGADKGKAQSSMQQSAKVSINNADAESLAEALSGVGIKKAEAIVAWRKSHGKFTSIDQLAQVKGIGEATIDKNRNKLTL